MRKALFFGIAFTVVSLSWTVNLYAIPFDGIEFPDGEVSFADVVFSYAPGDEVEDPYDDPFTALGAPDYSPGVSGTNVALGHGGTLILQFFNNSLTTSSDSSYDLWVFEIGPAVEGTSVAISTDAINWIEVGEVGGSIAGVDIDAYVGAGVELWEQYSYVRLTDLEWGLSGVPYAGADIDAVGAISSAPPVDPVPEPATMFLLGSGLFGLAAFRRKHKKK